MAIIEDWAVKAAEEIYDGRDTSPGEIVEVIRQHCPFKPDVAYEEVKPERPTNSWCINCFRPFGNLTRYKLAPSTLSDVEHKEVGPFCEACYGIVNTQIITSKEPPLLQCIDCKNTESPAGAMARMFNHGRCMHCGGYFKVIRA